MTSGIARTSWPTLVQGPRFQDEFFVRKMNNRYTPDIVNLEKKNGHLLFVYGSLKSNFPRHDLLKGSRFVACALTNNPYALFYDPTRKDDRFPVLLSGRKIHPEGHVVGQVWMVRPETIMMLDRVERQGDLFQRLEMSIQLVTRPPGKEFQQYASLYAWGYMGRASEWWPLIDLKQYVSIPRSKLYSQSDEEKFINWTHRHTDVRY